MGGYKGFIQWRRRSRLLKRQHGRCGICGYRIRSIKHASIDHVVPKSKGGDDYGNRVVAHVACNTRKADRMPTGCELLWLEVSKAGREAALQGRLGLLTSET